MRAAEPLRPMVGRDAEKAALAAALDALDGGRVGWLTLIGEPGIGKTCLLAELAGAAAERGHLVLTGRGAEFERDIPFAPWIDALDDHVAQLGPVRLAKMVGPQAHELPAIFPALARSGAAAGPPGLPAERYRAHRAVRALLVAVAAERPVVVVLDDLHWADPASLELLTHLLRHPPAAPVLVAVAFRSANVPPELGATLEGAGGVELRLAPLGAADVDALLGPDVPPSRRRELFVESGGNPFYLRQLSRLRDPAGGADGRGVDVVPPAVVAALRQEIDMVEPPARLLAQGAAVVGEPFDLELAAFAAGLDGPTRGRALDELVAADLVRPAGVPMRFQFRHPVVRRAVLDSAGHGWRIAAHGRAAAALEAAGAPIAVRAHHVERSAESGDVDAARTLLEAGRQVAASAPAAAIRWFEAALRLLPPARREARLQPTIALARSRADLGRLDGAKAALLSALDLAGAEDRELRAELIAGTAALEHLLGRHDLARDRLLRAIAELRDVPDAASATLQLELSAADVHDSRWASCRSHARAARRDAERGGHAGLAAVAAALDAFAHVCANGVAGDSTLDEATDVVAEAPGRRADALFYLGNAALWGERFDAAEQHLRSGVEACRESGAGQLLVPTMTTLVRALVALGRLGAATELAQASIESARLAGLPQLLLWALSNQSWAAWHAGDASSAVALGAQAAELADGMPQAGLVWMAARAHLGFVCLEAGATDRGRAALEAAGAPGFAMFSVERRCHWYAALARAELARGDRPAAERWLDLGEEAADVCRLPVSGGAVRRARAEALLLDGVPGAAAELALAAADAADGRSAVVEAARSRIVAGRALAAAGDIDRAVGVLREAEETLARSGAWGYRDEAAAALRPLGHAPPARGAARAATAAGGDLTAREQQVADLVAEGRTNRQIATALFVSEKTVEVHLSRVFAKLGVRSRAAVAAVVGRRAVPG